MDLKKLSQITDSVSVFDGIVTNIRQDIASIKKAFGKSESLVSIGSLGPFKVVILKRTGSNLYRVITYKGNDPLAFDNEWELEDISDKNLQDTLISTMLTEASEAQQDKIENYTYRNLYKV